MTGFAGVARFDERALTDAERAGFRGAKEAATNQLQLVADGADLARDADAGLTLAFSGRVLPAGADGPEPLLSAADLLQRFRDEGPGFVDRIRGTFAIALVDERAKSLVLLRDHVGQEPLFWARVSNGIVFSTRLRALFAHPEVGATHDLYQLAWFFQGLSHWQEGRTVWEGIQRVPARGRVRADRRGVSQDRWLEWSRVPRGRARSVDEWVEAYSETFERAVRRAVSPSERAGSLLSGGLDSSSVATVLASQQQERGAGSLDTFSARFHNTPSSDEGEFIRAAAATPGIRSHELGVDGLGPFDASVLEHIAARDEPCYGANLYVNLALARQAQEHGVQVLFDGVDGDSVMGYGFERLIRLTLTGRWQTLRRELGDGAPRVGLTPRELFGAEVTQPLRASVAGLLPDSLRHRLRGWRGRGPGGKELRPEFLGQTRAQDALAGLSFPQADLSARSAIRSGLESSFNQSILELLGGVARAHGLRAAYPFFDRDLIEFSLGLPDDLRLRDGWTRWIQRQGGFRLPREIRWRPWKHLLSGSFCESLLTNHRGLLNELGDEQLELYKYVRKERVLEIRSRFFTSPGPRDAFFLGKVLAVGCWSRT